MTFPSFILPNSCFFSVFLLLQVIAYFLFASYLSIFFPSDRLIASLQEGSSTPSSGSALELEDVKNERDLMREEVESLQSEVESCRVELAEAEAQVIFFFGIW